MRVYIIHFISSERKFHEIIAQLDSVCTPNIQFDTKSLQSAHKDRERIRGGAAWQYTMLMHWVRL